MNLVWNVCIFICIVSQVFSIHPYWRLVFSDEFEGNGVDLSKWNIRDHAGNYGEQEQQYYSPQQVTVSKGNLVITAANIPTNGFQYVSGWLDTQSKFYTTYGRYEFRAKMPGGGNGMWPALWILSQELCWPQGAECDIIEYRGTHPNDANGYYHYGTCCGCGTSSSGGTRTIVNSLADDFHIYALEWFPENMTWYMDGHQFNFFDRSKLAFNLKEFDPTPHYVIMNFAVGGGFAGVPDNTSIFPNSLYVDYVRVYQYGETCNGNTCSGNGCCDPNTILCVCNAGWSGSSCEQWTGSFDDKFVSTNIQYTPATDVKINGWGNGFTFYSDTNVAINRGLTITLTNHNCPAGCAGMSYSAGAWNSAQYFSYGTYSFIAKSTNIPGTGLSLQAAGQSALTEQISFVLTGFSTRTVQLVSWHLDYQFIQETVNLGFDASEDFHNYTFVYNPNSILYYIDGQLIKSTTKVIPNVTLAMGVYYTAQPAWYNGTFNYNGPSTITVSEATWTINPAAATCSAPTPAPPCQQSFVGGGSGLSGNYFDGDNATMFFQNYKLTRVDPTINFTWDQGSPATNVSSDYFSIRWTGKIQPRYSGPYTFYSNADDGVRLYVNGQLIIDAWVAPLPTVNFLIQCPDGPMNGGISIDVQTSQERNGTISLIGGEYYAIVLEFFESTDYATQILSWSSPCQAKEVIPQTQLYPCAASQDAAGNGLTGYYYSDLNLNDLAGTEIDPNINFNWGEKGPLILNGQVDQFSIQWTGFVQPRFSGNYTFYVSSDDGSRLYVNGVLLVDQWKNKSGTEFSGNLFLVQNQRYNITLQYYEDFATASVSLSWAHLCEAKDIIPQSQLFSA
eukprot:Phypoly_transcript_02660.p1 GENE.Phypoly_transcript_02660~~Phypoly_transcript_02660.p1  ORF type:complete len:843 (+),score=92.89 Phypoly_transcript_02660:142-2670(+)